MLAAVLTTHNAPLELVEVAPVLPLDYGQVLVKVLASGICGAQLQEIRGEKGGPLPHLLGHEGCGEVLEVGPGVTRVKPGDRVVMHWRKAAGIESAFPRYRLTGPAAEKGAGRKEQETTPPFSLPPSPFSSGLVTTFAEQSVCSENRLTVVPPDTSPELCALLGCGLSTALGTIEQECHRFGENILVLGLGGLGLSLLCALDLTTPARVCACDIHESKRRRAEIAGAEFVNTHRDKISGRFDLVLDTAGDPTGMEQALDHLAPSGRYVMIGQPPPGKPVCIAGARHMFEGEGKSIRATQGGGFRPDLDIPRYLRAAESLLLHNLITHRFPLTRINDALDLVRAGEAGRVLLEIGKS